MYNCIGRFIILDFQGFNRYDLLHCRMCRKMLINCGFICIFAFCTSDKNKQNYYSVKYNR